MSAISRAEAHLPLKPVVFQILLALARGPLHGYAVLQAVREASGGQIALETGPLYRHLSKLLDSGLVGEAEDDSDDPRRGRTYRLSDLGRAVVRAETARLKAVVRLADAVAETRR